MAALRRQLSKKSSELEGVRGKEIKKEGGWRERREGEEGVREGETES